MKIYQGRSIINGIESGKLVICRPSQTMARQEKITDTEGELQRFYTAQKEAIRQLQQIYRKALSEVGPTDAAVFEMHQVLLKDPDYLDSIVHMIREQKLSAECAVAAAGEKFSGMLAAMEDTYMQGRAEDVQDISRRVLQILAGKEEQRAKEEEPYILAADGLTPSEMVQLDKSKLVGIVTEHGSAGSHTAILAKSYEIPLLMGIRAEAEWEGRTAIIDGYSGRLILEPDEKCMAEMRRRKEEDGRRNAVLEEQKGRETVTRSGRRIRLCANIGNVADAAAALKNDAEGIGLFRSEFLYLEKDTYPTEEEQFQAYKLVASRMAGRKVIIRTMDLGADKRADYFGLEPEENPAMGYRGIRISLDRKEIFRTQLRAIYRASMFGNLAVMFPLIISVEEVVAAKQIAEAVKQELKEQGIGYQEIQLGVMIETPAAVWISDELAREAAFFSIGTNDLTQYILAVDRQNPRLVQLYDTHHPAVLRAIKAVIDSAHRNGIQAGICGELGSDLSITEELVRMGVDELSVSPASILPVRKRIREIL